MRRGLIVNPFRMSSFNPDAEPSLIFAAVADDNGGADGSSVSTWAAHGSFPSLANDAWSFGTSPILKTNILNGHKVVRFDGVANQNNQIVSLTLNTSTLLVCLSGVKRGTTSNSGFLNINDGSSDDYDSTAESSFYEGTGKEFLAAYRNNGRLALSLHPGVGIPFIYICAWDGTNNIGYLGDWPSLSAASAGAFNSTTFGVGARHTSGGYNNNSQIDIAETRIFTATGGTLRRNYVKYLNGRYSITNPKVLVVGGDSISQPGQWPDMLATLWDGTLYHVENYAVGGHNLDQVTTDLSSTANLSARITERVEPGKTVVFIWEYVNAKNAGNTDQQVVDKTKAIADTYRPLGAKILVAQDFHDATSSVNCQGASALMLAQYSTWADGIVNLNLQSLRDDSNNNSDHTHLSAVGEAIVRDAVKAAAEALI